MIVLVMLGKAKNGNTLFETTESAFVNRSIACISLSYLQYICDKVDNDHDEDGDMVMTMAMKRMRMMMMRMLVMMTIEILSGNLLIKAKAIVTNYLN